jgi:hypothetical protein
MIAMTDSPAVAALRDAASPILNWLFIAAGIGLGIGAMLFVLSAGWSLLRSFIWEDTGANGSWGGHAEHMSGLESDAPEGYDF